LSRSSLRMNDIVDRSGPALMATVDHLRKLIKDEVGSLLTENQFAEWLVTKTADTLARKEHARVRASNTNMDNLGIGELVDFGEANYDPFNYKVGSDVYGSNPGSSSRTLRAHTIAAGKKIAETYGFSMDFEQIFDQTYSRQLAELEKQDAARILLDQASNRDLSDLGLSLQAIREINRLSAELPFGILSLDDLRGAAISESDLQIILDRTTTTLQKLSNGHILAPAVMEEVGGANGVREIMKAAIASLIAKHPNDPTVLTKKSLMMEPFIEALNQQMTKLGTNRFKATSWTSRYGANVVGLMSEQISHEISTKSDFYIKAFDLKSRILYCKDVL